MTVQLIEGWDHETTNSRTFPTGGNPLPAGLIQKGWAVYDTNLSTPQRHLGMDTGRLFGGGCVYIDNIISGEVNDSYIYKFLPSGLTTLAVGFAFRAISSGIEGSVLPTRESQIFAIGIGNSPVAYLSLDTYGHIGVFGVVQGAPIIQLDAWHYIELKAVIAGASSTVEVHIDGGPYIPSTTCDLGSSAITTIGPAATRIGGIEVFYEWDDTYVDDTDFLGDCLVQTLYPNSDGTYNEWTPNLGGSHYAMVDEAPPDDDTSVVWAVTAGKRDTYNCDQLEISLGIVYGAQLNLYAHKSDPGTKQVAPMIRQAGSDYVGPTFTLTTSYLFYSWLLPQDPSSADWTIVKINTDEYGEKVIT